MNHRKALFWWPPSNKLALMASLPSYTVRFLHNLNENLTVGVSHPTRYIQSQSQSRQVTMAKPNQAFTSSASATQFVRARGLVYCRLVIRYGYFMFVKIGQWLMVIRFCHTDGLIRSVCTYKTQKTDCIVCSKLNKNHATVKSMCVCNRTAQDEHEHTYVQMYVIQSYFQLCFHTVCM